MTRKTIVMAAAAWAVAAGAQDARMNYQMQQALTEVPRLSQQFDQMQSAQDALAARMSRIERAAKSGEGDTEAEISALKSQIEQLKRDMHRMREEIVSDISKRMADLMAKQNARAAYAAQQEAYTPPRAPARQARGGKANPPPPQQTAPSAPTGPYYEHIVEAGQTLSAIAEGYGTTLKKVLAANPGVKPSTLKVGQKIIVPAEDKK